MTVTCVEDELLENALTAAPLVYEIFSNRYSTAKFNGTGLLHHILPLVSSGHADSVKWDLMPQINKENVLVDPSAVFDLCANELPAFLNAYYYFEFLKSQIALTLHDIEENTKACDIMSRHGVSVAPLTDNERIRCAYFDDAPGAEQYAERFEAFVNDWHDEMGQDDSFIDIHIIDSTLFRAETAAEVKRSTEHLEKRVHGDLLASMISLFTAYDAFAVKAAPFISGVFPPPSAPKV